MTLSVSLLRTNRRPRHLQIVVAPGKTITKTYVILSVPSDSTDTVYDVSITIGRPDPSPTPPPRPVQSVVTVWVRHFFPTCGMGVEELTR